MLSRSLHALFLILFVVGWVVGQTPSGDQGDLVQEMIAMVASYPKSLREPILTVAQHPAVVAKLAKRGPKDPLDPLLTGQPKEVQQAIQALAKYPAIVKTLEEDAAGMAALGKAYGANKAKLLEQVDQEAAAEAKATDAWANRLGQDADALDQLTTAQKAYQKHLGASAGAEDAVAESGAELMGNNLDVNALPAPGFSNYVMSNADVYPALANTMISQWLGTRNSFAYDRNFHQWWDRYQNHFHDEQFFHPDEHRADRLGDLARYDRKYAKDDKRWDKFNDRRKELEHAGKINPAPKDHRVEPGHKPHLKGGAEHKPVHKPVAGKHPTVRRGHPSEHHQAHHAAASHHHAASHRGRK